MMLRIDMSQESRFFFFEVYGHHRDLLVQTHSFPPRRSPALGGGVGWQDGTAHRTRGTTMTIADEAPTAPASTEPATRTAIRTCPLCEAGCGLEITLRPREGGGEEVRSEEHTSELQSLLRNTYAVFCLKNNISTINLTPQHAI